MTQQTERDALRKRDESLTDEQITAIQHSDPAFMTCSCKAFARAIEAHIKGDQA